MRLDKFLKVSRLIKRRTVAADAASLGRVLVNGADAKPGKQLKLGDILELKIGARIIRVEILSLNEKTRPDDAPAMYREIT